MNAKKLNLISEGTLVCSQKITPVMNRLLHCWRTLMVVLALSLVMSAAALAQEQDTYTATLAQEKPNPAAQLDWPPKLPDGKDVVTDASLEFIVKPDRVNLESGVEIAKTARGESVSFCQKDIREVQLAKSAIRAGLEILIRRAGLKSSDISDFYIAGGFGYNIDRKSAVGIGLLPAELEGKIKLAGNSVLGGVTAYLNDPGLKDTLNDIIGMSEEFSLSESDDFQDMFIEYMSF